jgi:hypothetical protein
MTVAALLAWSGLALQLGILVFNAATGRSELTLLEAVWRFLGYFTILTNIVVAVSYSARLWAPDTAIGRFFARPVVDSGVLAAITLVGVVYITILQRLWQPQGAQLLADILLHYVAPLGYIIYWIAFVPRGLLRWSFVLSWLIYPTGYLIYAMLRGRLDNWYAYPFIDVVQLGYLRVFANAAGLIAIFLLAGLLLIVLDRAAIRLRPRVAPSAH